MDRIIERAKQSISRIVRESGFDKLARETNKIFSQQGRTPREWPQLSTLGYVSRESVRRTYSSVSSLKSSTSQATPLRDNDDLYNSVTSITQSTVRRISKGENNVVVEFGSQHPAAHRLHEGGNATGLRGDILERTLGNTTGKARSYILKSYRPLHSGQIPPRRFLPSSDRASEIILETINEELDSVVREQVDIIVEELDIP